MAERTEKYFRLLKVDSIGVRAVCTGSFIAVRSMAGGNKHSSG